MAERIKLGGNQQGRMSTDEPTVPLWRLKATQAVLADRERELLELKGPCSGGQVGVGPCRLHHAHAGPCDTREADRAD